MGRRQAMSDTGTNTRGASRRETKRMQSIRTPERNYCTDTASAPANPRPPSIRQTTVRTSRSPPPLHYTPPLQTPIARYTMAKARELEANMRI
jgi:hypothetical protein